MAEIQITLRKNGEIFSPGTLIGTIGVPSSLSHALRGIGIRVRNSVRNLLTPDRIREEQASVIDTVRNFGRSLRTKAPINYKLYNATGRKQ